MSDGWSLIFFFTERRVVASSGSRNFGETFGLSVEFLQSVGINEPLHSKIFVRNVRPWFVYIPRLSSRELNVWSRCCGTRMAQVQLWNVNLLLVVIKAIGTNGCGFQDSENYFNDYCDKGSLFIYPDFRFPMRSTRRRSERCSSSPEKSFWSKFRKIRSVLYRIGI